jgi:thiamine-monophosphate kinase
MREMPLLEHVCDPRRSMPAHVAIGPGDDMGMLRITGSDVLVTVDQLADGVHFDLAVTPLHLIARKAMTRNLSDVAAMAAVPVGAVVAVSFPREMGQDRATQLLDAMRAVGQEYHCPVIGGDISIWTGPLIITVTVLASPAGLIPIRRDGAKVGDIILITGRVGGAWNSGGPPEAAPHLNFVPRIDLARQLAQLPGVAIHSMIDLSDGLASDLPRICHASSVAAILRVADVPLRPEAHAAAARDPEPRRPAWLHGLTDGEDYELCLTASPEAAAKIPLEIGGVPITAIGRIVARTADDPPSAVTLILPDGSQIPLSDSGYEHHA